MSASILKAVYYPGGRHFLEADLGSSTSCIWRSIVDGREVLKEGLIRRIDTGETTAIWTTNWLPLESLRHPIRLDKPNTPQMVSELINQAEVTTIANIPLCTRRQEDLWAWYFDKQGSFSVCSAYHMPVRRREKHDTAVRNIAGRSDHRTGLKEWMSLW